MTERKPVAWKPRPASVQPAGALTVYSTRESYASKQLSGASRRAWSGLWYAVALQHQDSDGHPMGYANAVRGVTSGAFATATAAAKAVSGIVYDRDPRAERAPCLVPPAWTTTKQDTVNLRVGYDLSATQESRPACPGGTTTAR